ncbi:aldo/keto reductase [Algivirga pacifica]|uniref:Aldo/keto reductase family oxidoreductase n=1 Tax=Algivirga pacifica TaxID=1162670 RepID=A0ABP9DHF4_9BACT
MTKHPLKQYIVKSSPIAYGCMGLGGGWNDQPVTDADVRLAHEVVDAALEAGITFFDHADIYTFGKAEEAFGKVLKERPDLRGQIALQSKCGIRFEDEKGPKRYDFSKEWITTSVENILKRLQTDYLEVLLLHRPDPLMEVDEVAEAFDALKAAGKVRQFGVSNMNGAQMAYLQSALDMPLVANQIEVSLKHLAWLEEGVTTGAGGHGAVNFAAGTLPYCALNGIQIQSWGSLAQGIFSGRDVSGEPEHIQKTAALVAQYAEELGVSQEAIVLAWLMQHPAKIQPVIGTTNPQRIKASAEAVNVSLSRAQWYSLFVAARGEELP